MVMLHSLKYVSPFLCLLVTSLTFGDRGQIHPTKVIQNSDSNVKIFDNVFSKKMLSTASHLLTRLAPWDFIYPEKYEGMQSNDNGDLHWIAAFSPKDFLNSKIWKTLEKKLHSVFEGKQYFPYESQGVLISRGDFPTVQKGKKNGDLLIRIFLTDVFKKNDYSEIVFYDGKGEIFGSVHPKFGKVVIWNDTTDFIFKPPSMNQFSGEYSLFIKASADKSKFDKSVRVFKEKKMARDRIAKEPFPLTNVTDESISKIDLDKHVTKKFYDSENRVVAVFDGVVPKDILFMLRKYFFQYDSSYVFNVYDTAYDEGHDNVNWVAQVPPELLPSSKVWQYIKHVATYLSNESSWHPYDVSMNIIQHNHHPRIHTDCNEREHEYTFLMYLTPEWNEDRYGETIFFEERNKSRKRKSGFKAGNEQYETLGAVRPKFGRIVMFRNIIEHSARPPSPDFLAARYTFAVKVSRSPQIAVAKMLRETLGDIVEEGMKGYKLLQELEEGKYDSMGNDGHKEYLTDKYSKYKKIKEKRFSGDKERYFKMLSLRSSS